MDSTPTPSGQVAWYLWGTFVIDAFLLFSFFWFRIGEALVSPWQTLPLTIFLLYALASSLFILLWMTGMGSRGWIALLSHAAATWLVLAVVYAEGFGFDPLIHQAMEREWIEQGISLRSPLYIFQYLLIAGLGWITRLPVQELDRWLVPCVFLGLLLIAWRMLSRERRWLLIPLFFFGFSAPTFTIPYHLAVALLLFVLLLTWGKPHLSRRAWMLVGGATVCAVASHPLIGVPMFAYVIGLALWRGSRRIFPFFALTFAIPLLFLCLFALGGSYMGAHLVWPDVASVQRAWWALFGPTYDPNASLIWKIFYQWFAWWPWVLIAVSLWTVRRHAWGRERAVGAAMATAAGCFLSAIALALFVDIPAIAAADAFEFSLRLLALLPIFFLPGLALFLHRLLSTKHSRVGILATVVGLSLVATGAWYMTYPQHNPAMHAFAASLGHRDLALVREIHQQAQGRPYAVLSSTMLGAAALREFGWKLEVPTRDGMRFAYPLPSGGELDQLYQLLLINPDEGRARAFDVIQSEMIFFVTPSGSVSRLSKEAASSTR